MSRRRRGKKRTAAKGPHRAASRAVPSASSKSISNATSKGSAKARHRAISKSAFKASSNKSSGAASKTAIQAASRPVCHFLRVPIEIRLKIYRHLLLDPPCAELDPYPSSANTDNSDVYYNDGYYEDDMIDYHGFNSYGIDMEDMSDGLFNAAYLGDLGGDVFGCSSGMGFDLFNGPRSSPYDDESSYGSDFPPILPIKRHLSILRTNRQIYSEASDLLHSELKVIVGVGDALVETPGSNISTPTEKVWRHDPAKGLGRKNIKGQTEYESPLMDGSMEPHVFAHFERIIYNCEFDFDIDVAPSMYVNDKLGISAEDANKFLAFLTTAKSTTRWIEDPLPADRYDNGLRNTLADVEDITISSITVTQLSTTDVIQRFVDLISRSPFIRHLELRLFIDAKCSNFSDDIDFDNESSISSEGDKQDVADMRATELFLESGVLVPLGNLSNVRTFSLEIVNGDLIDRPHQKHSNIVKDLKQVIENNWEVKHASRQVIDANSRCQ